MNPAQAPQARRLPFCTKIPYPTWAVAEFYRPSQEAKIGRPLRPYRCRSRACRPLILFHLTSSMEGRTARKKRRTREYREAVRVWESEGGAIRYG